MSVNSFVQAQQVGRVAGDGVPSYAKFQIDLFCYDLNIWYMGCDCKFHNLFN